MKSKPAANKVLPQWGLPCFYETFVGKRTVVLLLNSSANNPPLRQYPKRWRKPCWEIPSIKLLLSSKVKNL